MACVFVINDEPDLMEVCATVLEDAGYHAIAVPADQEIVKLAEQRRPDAIVIDLVMPGTGGEEVIRTLRSSEVADVPIVAMSALPDGRDRATRAGADSFLQKPFGPQALVGAVNDTLRRKAPPAGAPA